jgi:Beta-lactamase class C and other penicillin binding proteins
MRKSIKTAFICIMMCLLIVPAYGEYLVVDEDSPFFVSDEELAYIESQRIDALADKVFKNYSTVGGAVVVMKHGEMVYERYYGLARKGGSVPVDENTYFRVASISKWITGIGVMKLVEEGKLSLEDDIGDVLDMPIKNPKYPEDKVTLRMVMSHTSSITDSGGFKNQSSGLSDIFSKARIKSSFVEKRPGAEFNYSNFAAGITGSMIEMVTAQNVNDYMKEAVFEPLGVDVAYWPTLVSKPENIVDQHERGGVLSRPYLRVLSESYDPSVNVDMHYRLTAGCVWSNARDLAKLASVMTGAGEADGVRIISEESVKKIHEEQQGKDGITADTPYALFCERFTTLLEGKIIYGHQGQSLSMVTEVFYDLDTGFAMVLLTNGCSKAIDRRICKIGRSMFDVMYPAFSY